MSVSHIKLRGKPCIAFIFQQFQLISSEFRGEFPVKSKVITCKNTYSFSCNIYMCSQSENYGDFRQCVIPVTITCTLQAGALSAHAPRLGKGAFTNYVCNFLAFFDNIPTLVCSFTVVKTTYC